MVVGGLGGRLQAGVFEHPFVRVLRVLLADVRTHVDDLAAVRNEVGDDPEGVADRTFDLLTNGLGGLPHTRHLVPRTYQCWG